MCACMLAASETVFEELTETVKDVLFLLQKGNLFTAAKKEKVKVEYKDNAALLRL